MTTLMAQSADMAEVVLIQGPALRWVADIRGGNSGQQDTGVSGIGGVVWVGEAMGIMVEFIYLFNLDYRPSAMMAM
jgi:hypothetical protein